MPEAGSLYQRIPRRWRYALVGGFLVLPSTTVGYLQTGMELVFPSVLLGGLLSGYLAERQFVESRGVGGRVGLVGAVPGVWFVFDAFVTRWTLSGLSSFALTVVTAGVTAAVATLGLGAAALVGEVGGRIGAWVAKTRPGHSTPAPDI